MAWGRKHSGSAQTVCSETQSLPLRNQPTGLKTWEQSCMEVSASRLAQKICFHDRFSLAGDGRCPFETTESVNKHKMSKKKIDELNIMLTASDFSTKNGSVVVGRRFGKMMKLAGPIKFGDIQTATEMFRDAYFQLMNDIYKTKK